MAELTRTFHWERFAPNIGNNLEIREQDRIHLEIAVGISVLELIDFHNGLKVVHTTKRPTVDTASQNVGDLLEQQLRPAAEALAEKWGPFVRLVGAHSVNGRAILKLSDYLLIALNAPGIYNVIELVERLDYLNSVRGTRELFSDAPSGGSSSTEERSSAPEEPRTADQRSG